MEFKRKEPEIDFTLTAREAYIIAEYISYYREKVLDGKVVGHPWLEFSQVERKSAIDFFEELGEFVDEHQEYT